MQVMSVSEITAIEYSRFLVEEEHKRQADERKQKHEVERNFRKEMQERYMQAGANHQAEYKYQMAMAKQEVDNHHRQNLDKGAAVKAEVEALAKARQEQQKLWQEHSSSLARELGSEQKRRIKTQRGSMTTRKREVSQAVRSELSGLEKARTERRNQAVENRKQLRERIQSQTSDQVTQEAKDVYYQQRKAAADDGRASMKKWKEQRQRDLEQHASKALKAREAAKAGKAAAKASLEAAKTARTKAAKEMRERKLQVGSSGSKYRSEIKSHNRVVHDMLKTQKFITPDLAKEMKKRASEAATTTSTNEQA